jgi:hypothetical protein
MFVRWRHRFDKLTALLVKSARVNGAPRQQHIAVLGSVPESGGRWRDRCEFWEAVVNKLDNLPYRMSLAERIKIEDAIALKVPRPNKRERAQWHELQKLRRS